MPQGKLWNRFIGFIFLLTLLHPGTANAQQPPALSTIKRNAHTQHHAILDNPIVPESDCSNGIDDNNNGLTDRKDFHCYFNEETTMEECKQTKIIWASSNWGLHWIDLETNEERLVVPRDERTYDDITWASNGKLYGADRLGGIFEIDPYTYQNTFIGEVEGHYYSNGMTADGAGKLYLASFTTTGVSNVMRLDLATRKSELVVSLTDNGLTSAGDLCFVNGYLYVSCMDNTIAKINMSTKKIEKLKIINSPVLDGPYGMTYLGDGYLYISNNMGEIHRVDLNTMTASYYTQFSTANFFTLGFTSYTDLCNAPGCRAKVNITADKFPPYCSAEGVTLTANGKGIKGQGEYVWTLPNGNNLSGKTIHATVKGKYYVRYYSIPETCSISDSITLNIVSFPTVNLGVDTFVCTGKDLALKPKVNDDNATYYWDDGSTSAVRSVNTPGRYWVEVVSRCGIASDTIYVSERTTTPVYLGGDTLLCPGTSIILRNSLPEDAQTKYTWSGTVSNNSIIANGPGTYWLESSNACGTVHDDIVISANDSCICKPFYAKADAGNERWLCSYDTLMLRNTLHQDGFRYSWNAVSADQEIIVRQPGTYTLDVSTYCGTVSDTIIVHRKIDDCECFVYAPNAFTPNSDNNNDRFEIKSNCILKGTIRIFNRWGGVVYYSENLKNGWNGKVGNEIQPSGLYVYQLRYEYVNRPGAFTKKGSFSLIR